jgi:GNAT superfamily N-acetyltransferase
MENSLENFEPTVTILNKEDLLKRIYQGKSSPQDSRFLPVNNGGVFKYFHLEDIIGSNYFSKENKLYPSVQLQDKIVGISELEQDPYNENNFWIKFVSVDPLYQGNGYASKIIKKIFEFAKENNYSLEPSFYTEQGEEKLKNVLDRERKETGVTVIERYK